MQMTFAYPFCYSTWPRLVSKINYYPKNYTKYMSAAIRYTHVWNLAIFNFHLLVFTSHRAYTYTYRVLHSYTWPSMCLEPWSIPCACIQEKHRENSSRTSNTHARISSPYIIHNTFKRTTLSMPLNIVKYGLVSLGRPHKWCRVRSTNNMLLDVWKTTKSHVIAWFHAERN